MIERIIEKVREIPTRPGNIGGQNYKYVRLEEVIGLLLDALDSYEAKPLPEPVAWTNKHELGDQEYCSNSRRMWVTPGCGGNMPLYAEPQARSPLSDDFLSQVLNEGDGTYRP